MRVAGGHQRRRIDVGRLLDVAPHHREPGRRRVASCGDAEPVGPWLYTGPERRRVADAQPRQLPLSKVRSRPPDDKPGPVILVPGYGGDDSMLAALAVHLEKAGRTAIVLALPDSAEGDLRVQAGILAARVTLALKGGAASVDLVGYSAGGVVIGLFVAAHPGEVRRIVSIGSPLHGTQIAGLAVALNMPASVCGVACRQMAPGTSLLASLSAAEPAVTGVPWTSIWTTDDQVVLPA